jgi:hypothetical protein
MCTLKSDVSGHILYDIFYLFLYKESHYDQLLQEFNSNLHINFFDSNNYYNVTDLLKASLGERLLGVF